MLSPVSSDLEEELVFSLLQLCVGAEVEEIGFWWTTSPTDAEPSIGVEERFGEENMGQMTLRRWWDNLCKG